MIEQASTCLAQSPLLRKSSAFFHSASGFHNPPVPVVFSVVKILELDEI
jgi:hypothetical protein